MKKLKNICSDSCAKLKTSHLSRNPYVKRKLKLWSSKFLHALPLNLLQQLQEDILELTVLMESVGERGEYLEKYKSGEIEKTNNNNVVYQVLLHEESEFFTYCDTAFRLRLFHENKSKGIEMTHEEFTAEIKNIEKSLTEVRKLWDGYMHVNVGRSTRNNVFQLWHTTSYMLADFFEIQQLTEHGLIDPSVIAEIREVIGQKVWLQEDMERTAISLIRGKEISL